MKDDDPNLAFNAGPADSELATHPVHKITWALAGRVTDPGRYMFKFGWLTRDRANSFLFLDEPLPAPKISIRPDSITFDLCHSCTCC